MIQVDPRDYAMELTVGAVARMPRRSGVSTIHFYESRGLITSDCRRSTDRHKGPKPAVVRGAEIAQERTLTDCGRPEVGHPVPNKDMRMTRTEADADQVVGQRARCVVVIGPLR
jgi:hypothetical protein